MKDRQQAAANGGAARGSFGSGTPIDFEAPDEIDRAFARLTQLPPPRDFATSVLLAARAYRPGRRQIAWAVAEVCAILALTVLAFVAGQALVLTGTFDLASALFADAEVLRLMPGESILALVESLPWIELAALAVTLVTVVLCTRGLARALADPTGWRRANVSGGAG